MKKLKLFLAACAAMVGLSANAQSWTAPVIGSEPTAGSSYKLMNVGAGQFLVGAKVWYGWATSTGLTSDSNAALSLTANTSGAGWTLTRSDGKGVFISGAYNGKGEMHVDGGTPTVVEFTKQSNGFYRIRAVSTDATYGSSMDGYDSKYWGWEGYLSRPTNAVYATIVPEGNNCDWAFLSTDDVAGLEVYKARVALYQALVSAESEGASIDAASAVYNNNDATVEELTNAKTALNEVRLAHALDVASDTDPRDITEFVLTNPDFSTGNINGWETNYVSGQQATNIGYQDNNNYVNSPYYLERFIEAWRSGNAKIGDGYLRQTVSNMPEGKYVLECDAIATNQGNTSATTTGALLYINADGVDFTTSLSTAGSAVQHFSTEFLFTGEGDVIFGLKTQNTSANWIAADNFKVTYYGIDLTAYETQLAAAVAAFEALEGKVPSETYNTKKTNVLDVYNKEWTSSKDYSTAIAAIQAAISELSALAAGYSEYNTVRDAVVAAYASTDVTSADAAANAATTVEEMTEAIAAVRTALKSAITANNPENVNLTAALLINPSFETGDFTGWTNTGMSVQGNESFGKVGNYYAECWVPDGTKSIAQTLSGMPGGVYKVTATIKARGVTSAELSAGGVSKAMTISDEQSVYTVEFACDENAEFTIKYEGVGTGAGSSWLCADDFTLTYVGALPELTAVTGKMNADVAAAQTTAIETYNANKTVANYNAASAAITAAETSVAAYAKTATALADANALKDAHNFASAEATTTFVDAIAAVQTKYDEGTLTDVEATAGGNLGTVATNWHAGNNNPAAVYLRDGFALGDFEADPALHVNTWSTEGDGDGTGFSIPFYESWTADANNLPESTLTGTLTDLPNGLYKVSAWVRVAAKSGVNATDAAGITMNVNNGTAVDVTAGEVIGTTQRSIATYEAEGLVKDGKLTLNFNIAADANISWLAFKNVKYTKVRDLTPEEMAVAPTAIALYNGETEVTEVSLDATTTTVTLTPQFTPADATPTVTWASSDETVATVADGVVTAVSSGTTTITVKSTLDENVSASATVTVSFPETEVAAYTNDGATRYVHHYGDNIIKNGTFQYPNPFQGWKSGANGNCDANNFNIVTEDENKYIQAKQSMGAGDSHSISTGWPIEAGKTYVFGYKVKASKAGTMQFLVTSLTNSIGTETAQLDTENERKAKSVTTSWTDVKYEFTNSDNYAFVQFRARWMADSQSFDDFYLVEKTADDDVIGNVEYATAAIPTANIGTGAFQYSQNAVDAANALVQGTATVADVEAAYAALTTVNAPAEGQLFNVVLTYAGWTYDNKAMTFIANDRTDGGLYNIQYKEVANQNLAQAFTFTKVEGNNFKMSQIDADGNVRYMTTGVPYGGNTSQIRTSTNADDAMVVTVIPTATEGVWNLKNVAANQYIGSQDNGVFTVNSHINFFIVETTKPSITINTTAAGWGTTMLPFAVSEIPDGVKVYSCAEAQGATLTLTEVTALEANKPYIIEGDWEATLTGDAQGTALTYTDGLLVGTYSKIAAPDGDYILQKQGEKVGFFKVDTSVAQPNVPANRAYLKADEANPVKAFFLGDDAADAINGVFDGLVNGDAYDLGGRKVSKLQKGNVYIVNGKKVVVK